MVVTFQVKKFRIISWVDISMEVGDIYNDN
jgi:hypothetical protein